MYERRFVKSILLGRLTNCKCVFVAGDLGAHKLRTKLQWFRFTAFKVWLIQ